MSIDIEKSNQTYQIGLEDIENLGIGEALAHLLSAASVVDKLGEFGQEEKAMLMRYIDNWIVSLSPIQYQPGIVDKVADSLVRRTLDILDFIPEDELTFVLEGSVYFSSTIRGGENHEVDLNDLEDGIVKVLKAFGVDVDSIGVYQGDINKRLSLLIAYLSVAMVIGMVSEKLWPVV